uniref:Uncharacterized protein n=1 Tax=Ciona savignyi TaxID=51511 RepID=H2ZHE9_CIOSA
MDSRSFARLGLYVPRENPHRTFLKTYKGEDGIEEPNSESDFVGFTSVRVGSNQQQKVSWKPPSGQRMQPSLPSPRVRKVIREAWLNGDLSNTGEQQRASRNSSHYSSVHRNESGEEGQMKRNYRAPSTTPRKQVPRAQSGSMNIKGQQVNNASPEPTASKRSTPGGSRVSKACASPAERKRSIEAIIPCTD